MDKMRKKHNKLNEHNSSVTTVLLPNGDKIKLNNFDINNKPLIYQERISEVQSKILSLEDFTSDCEVYWFGAKNINGKWSEKVKSCLDVITTYLLRAPDSGIKNVVLH